MQYVGFYASRVKRGIMPPPHYITIMHIVAILLTLQYNIGKVKRRHIPKGALIYHFVVSCALRGGTVLKFLTVRNFKITRNAGNERKRRKGAVRMASYHCNAKVISRGKGRSAVGAAAYRSGEKITNEYDGLTHDYTKKGGVVYSEVMLCDNAPQEFKDRSVLWNTVEQYEKSAKAQLAREYEISLPVELTREEQKQLVRDYVQDNFVNNGMCADFSIHDKGDGNPHAHIMLTMRPIDKNGDWGDKQKKEYILDKDGNKQFDKKKHTYKCRTVKTTCWDDKDFLEKCREDLAVKINRELERKGLPDRVDHRSNEAQGKKEIPSQHLGVTAKNMERRGVQSERGNENREIAKANAEIKNADKAIKETAVEYMGIKQDISWNHIHEYNYKIAKGLNNPKFMVDEKTLLMATQTATKALEKNKQNYETVKTAQNYRAGFVYTLQGADGRNKRIPYMEHHTDKFKNDVAYIQKCIDRNLAALNLNRQAVQSVRADQPQAEARAVRQATTFDVTAAARQLATNRYEFVKATMQAAGRTNYTENPIYRQQAAQISESARTVSLQTATIDHLQRDLDRLGMFHGNEKKELQAKIDDFTAQRAEELKKLKELGISDPSKAAEAIKKNNDLADQEKARVQTAKESQGADSRAAEAKANFLAVAQSVPEEERQAVFDEMEKHRPQAGKGMTAYQAEITARRDLDTTLKPQSQSHEQEITQERGFTFGR